MLPGAAVGALLSPFPGKCWINMVRRSQFCWADSFFDWLASIIPTHRTRFSGCIDCLSCVYMIGIGLSYSNMMTTGMNALNEELQGDGNAMFNTLQQFSGAVATSLVAVIINYVQHHTSHNYEVSTTLGSKAALGVLLLLLLVSFARFAYYLFFAKSVDSIRQVLHLPFL